MRVIQFAAFAKQRMLRLIRLKIKNKMKGHHLIICLVVILAGFAFEAYTTPPESVGRKEVDVAGCKTVYLSESFAHEMYDGQLFIKLEKCFNLPAMDPWITHACSTGFLGTSDPYAVMELDGQVVKRNSHEVLVELEGIGGGGKLQLEAAMEVLKDGYQGDVIGEATPDVLLSEFMKGEKELTER